MSPPSAAARPARTWTGDDQGNSAKWVFVFWLALALCVGLGLFAWWMFLPNAARVHYVSLAVEDYGDVLPKPYYALWPADQIRQRQIDNDLEPWHALTASAASIQGRDLLEQRLGQLPGLLQQQGLQSSDTLILQLRMHAQTRLNEQGTYDLDLLTGERGATSLNSVGKFSVAELLKALAKIPAQNIVVLADICDLDYAPQIDLAVNPIASALQTICSQTQPGRAQDIWVLCAARDYERNYISHLRKRTLLQSACEFALARSSDSDGRADAKISLAEFYRQVWRYCRRASEPTDGQVIGPAQKGQMPLLMRVGQTELCQPNESSGSGWSRAEKVTMVRLAAASKTKQPGDQPNEQPNEQVPKDQPAAPGNQPTDKEPPLDAVMQYWVEREQLNRSLWPPALFAPHLWQAHQQLLAQLQFDLPGSQGKVDELLKELKELSAATTAATQTTEAASNQFLLRAFLSFDRDGQIKMQRMPWANDQWLPAADQARWSGLRSKYRTYAQTCAELPAWANWSRQNWTDITLYSGLIDTLLTLRRALPSENLAALDQTLPFETLVIDQAVRRLADVQRQAQQPLLSKMQASKKLSWNDELQLQLLIESPLLHLETRAALWAAWRKLQSDPLKYVVEPDKDFAQIKRDEALHANLGSFDNNLSIWLDATTRLGQLVHAAPITHSASSPVTRSPVTSSPVASGPVAGLNWCRVFGAAVSQSQSPFRTPQDSQLHRWHAKCLTGLFQSPEDTTVAAGIVLPASLSRALRVSVANPLAPNPLSVEPMVGFLSEDQKMLSLSIQRADGSEVDEARITWRLLSAVPKELELARCLTVSSLDDQTLLPETPVNLKVSNRTLNLWLKTRVDSRQLTSPMKLEIQVAEDFNSEAVSVGLGVVPRQPDIVTLTAVRVDGARRTTEETQDGVARLRIMAIDGAKNRFEFALNNLSSQPKRCQVTLYALPESLVSLQNSGLTVPRSALGSPLARSPLVELPSAAAGHSQPQALQLTAEAPGNPSASTPLKNATANVRWLYFLIAELGPDDKPLSDKFHTAFCQLEPRRPDRDVLTITPVAGKDFRLEIAANPAAWDIYGHSALKVQVTEVGRPLVTNLSEVTFTPQNNGPVRIQIKAADDQPASYRAQLSIGGYPRAVTFAAPVLSHPNPIARAEPTLMAMVRPETMRVVDQQRQDFVHQVKLENFHDHQYIFPMRDPLGTIEYSKLFFTAEFDVQSSDFKPGFQLFDAIRNQPIAAPIYFSSDRQFEFGFEFQGTLAITAKAQDLKAEFNTELKGKLRLQPIVQLASDRDATPVGQGVVLIFDGDKPEPVNIRVVDHPMSARQVVQIERGKKVTLRIKPNDALSGIQQVRMAIDGPGKLREQFDDDDFPLKGIYDPAAGEWEFVVDADTTAQSSLNRLTVVATSLDFAGNSQNAHPPVTILMQQPVVKPESNGQSK